jgi:hypothetical protein
MSILIENNQIHLIGNVEEGYIDNYVILPFLTVFEMIEHINPKEIIIHLSGKGTMCDITPIIDVIEHSKVPVDIYIQNSEIYGGYKGVSGELLDLLDKARKVVDCTDKEYDPPLHLSIPEIQAMREYDMYKYKNIFKDDDDNEDEDIEY